MPDDKKAAIEDFGPLLGIIGLFVILVVIPWLGCDKWQIRVNVIPPPAATAK